MVVKTSTKSAREYRQRVRAEDVAARTERILHATQTLAGEVPLSDVTLEAVARESGASVQTILRRFASREALIVSAFEAVDASAEARLAEAEAGDPARAIRLLVREYERWGDSLVHLLGQERAEPLLAAPLARGRREHEAWVRRVFAEALERRDHSDRRRLLAELIVVTDVLSWHHLRRVRRLGARETERAISEMALALIEE